MNKIIPALCILMMAAPAWAANPAGKAAGGLKIYISADMEGVAGAVTSDQLESSGFEYERFREFMTEEVLAAVRASTESGATEIVVGDAHGNGQNLLIDRFPRNVRIIRSWPRHGAMVAGIDSSFDALLLIGYHASSSSLTGVRAHTYSSGSFTGVALNGQQVGEGDFFAAHAGAHGVPVVFASGDDATIAELKNRLGNIETVETKRALSFHSASTLTPQEAVERIHTGVRAALARINDFKPYVLKTPVTLEISYKNYTPAEALSYLRIVQRVDAHTIRFVGRDMAEVTDFLEFAGMYNSDMSP